MPVFQYKEYIPKYNETNYIAPGAMLIGNVELSANVSVWHNCVLRGDVNSIKIGKNTNIQDLSMLHVTENTDLIIGENVSVGHSVTLHGCHIEKHCLIGMGTTILDNVYISKDSIVAAGSVVPPNKKFEPGVMIMGAPAKVVRKLTDQELHFVRNHYKSYLNYKEDFIQHIKEI